MHSLSSSRTRVLVLRSCRHPQFVAALALTRARFPDAEIWALAPEAFGAELIAAGVDRVVTHTASRLGAARLGLGTVVGLRRLGFAAVVAPLMDGALVAAANLLRLAWAIAAPAAVIIPGNGEPIHVDRRGLRRLAMITTLGCDGVKILWQMVVAWCAPRAAAAAARDRRRVLHIINSLGVGGAQTQIAELVNHTPPSAFSIDILVLDDGASRGRLERDDVRVLTLPVSPPLATTVDRVADVCRRGDYDIVHTWLPVANTCGTAGARLAGVPRIVTSVRSLNPGHYPQWCEWWFRPADVLAARLADVVTVNAAALAEDHGRWAWRSSRHIKVVHNGLTPPDAAGGGQGEARRWLRAQLSVGARTTVIGNVGRLAVEKDQATFVRAIGEARSGGHDVHAVIVGDGPCGPGLRRLVDELALAPHITFLGDRRDARQVIAGLDLLMLTSAIEGFPNVLLEAGLLGVPLLSSDVGGVRDLVTDGKLLFPPGDATAAAAAIAAAIADPAARVVRAERLRARCLRDFTTERMVARWLALYEPSSESETAFVGGRSFPRRRLARPAIWSDAIKGEPQ